MLSRVHFNPGKFWRVISPGLGGAILSFIVFCAPVIGIFWWLNIADNLLVNIAVTAFALLMPGLELWAAYKSEPKSLLYRWELFVCGLVMGLVLLFSIGSTFDWQVLQLNAVVLLFAVGYVPFACALAGWRWILLCALLLGLLVMMVYWLKAMAVSDRPLELLFLPVLVFMAAGTVWFPIARYILIWAERLKNRPLAGPGSQTLAMIALFSPVMLVAIFGPGMLELSPIWSAASLTVVGVLLSAVISQPLHRFLVEWAKLKPDDEQSGLL